ncbi:MAG: hypothetical protein AB7T22_15640 [Calditrichaceae bacterium]
MIDTASHAQKCRQLLSSFGEAQKVMLYLETEDALYKLDLIYNDLLKYISQAELKLINADRKHSQFIFKRQLVLIKRFITEFINDLPGFAEKNPEQVIRLFERHHLFKKVMLKHISDLSDDT